MVFRNMKIAILADLHLTDNFNTVKRNVLEWALAKIVEQNCNYICCIGDLTAQGSVEQADKVLSYLYATNIDFCSTPGNAELRIYSDGRIAKKFDILPAKEIPLILVDTSFDQPTKEDLEKISALKDNSNYLLATHNPIVKWNPEALEVVNNAIVRKAITGVIAGHSHHDAEGILRGLDPDKASGGAPMFSIFEQDVEGSWNRKDIVMEGIEPKDWDRDFKETFIRNLGVSTMWEEIEAFNFAISNNIKNVELRMGLDYPEELPQVIAQWRQNGGEILSLHLPELRVVDEEENLRKYAQLAVKLGCNRVTLHVPKVTAAAFESQKEVLLDNFSKNLQVLLDNNIVIGIENLHTTATCNTFETRNFGCTIAECYDWIMLLRGRFNTNLIGFHLDVGHARNNAPIAGKENLSDWYLKMGHLINGWHIHQVVNKDGKFSNHQPMTSFSQKLICLNGLIMALQKGQLNNAPMFLEARTWPGNVESYTKLIELL